MDPARRVFLLLSLIFTLALVMSSAQALAESIDLPVAFDASQVRIERSDEGSRYLLEGANALHASGAPELPYFTWKFVLPQGRGIADAEIVDARWVALDTPQQVAMVGALYTSEGETVYDTMDGLSDEWQQGEVFPSSAVRGQGASLLEGYYIGGVELVPLRVNGAGEVEILVKGRLRLELEDLAVEDPAQRAVAWPGVADAAAQRVRRLVRNPQAVEASAPSPGTPYELLDQGAMKTPHPDLGSEVFGGGMVEYVIVTVPSLVGEFQRLADDHIAHGVPTKVVSTDWIEANYAAGSDFAETLRNFLKKCYSDWGTRYAMIGGDADVIAPRYVRSYWFPTVGFSDIPCDLYFGGLDGNWNANGNGIFGEAYKSFMDTGDAQDMVAEIVVGRAPVKGLMEAATFVD